ncbi:MFS transporter [Sphaerochaeta globosa]|uniref:Major facilitator superfamily MFS_1 n=1 Tax=Sphaerochaeta globosa (strain ATCC BAA-1886 / DSM 22777 / Buddy) TaxID=158189 RepID=F0RWI5_SPHGB|nr:MFS transporter [Sphaerochaeta globosa]ADY13616.1 major facilitator superfamily MFS_1 [Sphaerochaeta globosa str. Buddy]
MRLLILIYLAFISLGLPDGVLGSVWPVMRLELGLPLASAGLIGAIGSIGTVASALLSYRLINRFGTAKVTLVSVLLTSIALFGYSISSSLPALMLFAIPLGLGAGSVDSALNNYVALHYEARHMNWLHSFWGLGATSGPAVMGLVLSLHLSYRAGYRTLAVLQLLLVVALSASVPLFERPKKQPIESNKNSQGPRKKHKALPFALLGFFLYCALEVSTGLWAVSYLVEVKGLLPGEAALYGSLFFLGITSGRIVSGFVSMRISNTKLIYLGLGICLVGLLSLSISPLPFAGYSLLLLGFGCAPVFPSMIHETPRRFSIESSQRIIGLQMASAYIGSTLTPPLFGVLGTVVGLRWMPLMQLSILLLLFLCMVMLGRLTKVNTL